MKGGRKGIADGEGKGWGLRSVLEGEGDKRGGMSMGEREGKGGEVFCW